MTDAELIKRRAEIRMALFDALPVSYRQLVVEQNASVAQMLALVEMLRRQRRAEPPAEDRLHRKRRG